MSRAKDLTSGDIGTADFLKLFRSLTVPIQIIQKSCGAERCTESIGPALRLQFASRL